MEGEAEVNEIPIEAAGFLLSEEIKGIPPGRIRREIRRRFGSAVDEALKAVYKPEVLDEDPDGDPCLSSDRVRAAIREWIEAHEATFEADDAGLDQEDEGGREEMAAEEEEAERRDDRLLEASASLNRLLFREHPYDAIQAGGYRFKCGAVRLHWEDISDDIVVSLGNS